MAAATAPTVDIPGPQAATNPFSDDTGTNRCFLFILDISYLSKTIRLTGHICPEKNRPRDDGRYFINDDLFRESSDSLALFFWFLYFRRVLIRKTASRITAIPPAMIATGLNVSDFSAGSVTVSTSGSVSVFASSTAPSG